MNSRSKGSERSTVRWSAVEHEIRKRFPHRAMLEIRRDLARIARTHPPASYDVIATDAAVKLIRAYEEIYMLPSADDSKAKTPPLADRILEWVVTAEKRNAFFGDRRERFEADVEKYGIKRARRLYWIDTWRSAWPLLWNLVVRLGMLVSVLRKILG